MPKLYAHVGIHNSAVDAELCHLQPMAAVSWGWPLVLGIGLVWAAYLGGGAYMGKHKGSGGGAAAALRRHPHREKWQDLTSLVHDGISYSRACVTGRGDGRATAAVTTRAGYRPVLEQASSHGKAKASKSKKSFRKTPASSSSTAGNSGDRKEGSSSFATRSSDGTSTPPLAVEPAAVGARSAAAGDGGRWVHIPG